MNASAFRDIWSIVMFLKFSNCNFENFKNITPAHISRNALAFIRFPIHTVHIAKRNRVTRKIAHPAVGSF